MSHGWLGVLCGADDTDRAAGGARLAVVVPGGPAAKAGLSRVTSSSRAGGDDVERQGPTSWRDARSLRPQDPLDVTYLRDGRDPRRRRSPSAPVTRSMLAIWPAMG